MRAALSIFLIIGALSAPASAFGGDSLISIGDRAYLTQENPGGPITYLRYPTLGCPALVVRGTSSTAWIRLPDGGATRDFTLSISSTGDVHPQKYPLTVGVITYENDLGIYKVSFTVPPAAVEDMYDLHLLIPSRSISDRQFNSLKVFEAEKSDYNFIVLADPQFNDPRGVASPRNSSPVTFDVKTTVEEAKREVRALRPDFAIFCGDLAFGMTYDSEYDGLWNVWKDAGFPVFMVPGNHDGYACTEDRSFLGITCKKQDGLDYWRRYLGPTCFSFDWGGAHFQGINTYDGTAERRDGFKVVVPNYGGDLSPDQMAWIERDLSQTRKNVIPFMHHNPLGPYTHNVRYGGLWQWLLTTFSLYMNTGRLADSLQVWNTPETGDFLKRVYEGRVKTAFIGHNHRDEVHQYNGMTFKLVTHLGSSGDGYWGYAYVKVRNSEVADYFYRNAQEQSIPTGNLRLRMLTANDGQQSVQKAEMKCGLAVSYDATLEFVLPTHPEYSTSHGSVLRTADLGGGRTRVWVKFATPVAASMQQPVQQEIVVRAGAVQSPPVAVEPSVQTSASPVSSGSKGKRARCGAGLPAEVQPGFGVLMVVLMAWALRIARRRV